MDKQRMIELRDNMSLNMPNPVLIKELCETLTGETKSEFGHIVQDVLLFLLDYYIENEVTE